jgi:hypothetical protein
MELGFSDCNWGDVPDVEAFLKDNGVSYNKYWGAGSEYGPGADLVRFAKNGEMRLVETSDDQRPDVPRLIKLLEKGDTRAALIHLREWWKSNTEPCPLGQEPDEWEEED